MSELTDFEKEAKADIREAQKATAAEKANKPWVKRLSLTTWIFIALALGVVAGLALQGTPDIATTYIKPLGTIFLNLIKMIVVPLVIFSMVAGVISLSDIKRVGAIGGKTIAYYLCTTACAIVIGLVIANLLNVGAGYTLSTDELNYEAKEAPSFIDTIVNIFPSNFVQPMSDASMLQIIVIALFFGFGILAAGKKAQPVADFVNGMSEVCIKIMHMIISIAPFGVFGLITPVVATNGPDILLPLLKLILIAYLAMILHMVVVYSGAVKTIAKMGPLTFFKGQMRAMAFAFASASSVGTLPINMECSRKLGVRSEVSSFVLPLGATMHMDGSVFSAILKISFLFGFFGMPFDGIGTYVTALMIAIFSGIAMSGVAGGGFVGEMVIVSLFFPEQMGIAFPVIATIGALVDPPATCINASGDTVASMIVARFVEGKDWFQKKQAERAEKAGA